MYYYFILLKLNYFTCLDDGFVVVMRHVIIFFLEFHHGPIVLNPELRSVHFYMAPISYKELEYHALSYSTIERIAFILNVWYF